MNNRRIREKRLVLTIKVLTWLLKETLWFDANYALKIVL